MKSTDTHPVRLGQVGVCILIAMLILLYRAPERLFDGCLWAEDAKVFISGYAKHGSESLVTPYAGYLHLLPRLLVAVIMGIWPVDDIPYLFALACVLVYSLATAYLFVAFRQFEGIGRWAATLAAAMPFLVPQSGEVLLTVTNLQWILSPCLAMLLWNVFAGSGLPVSRRSAIVTGGMLVLLCLTGPFVVFLLPFCVLAFICRRRVLRHNAVSWVYLALVAACAGIQLVCVYLHGSEDAPFALSRVPPDVLVHVFAEFYVRQYLLDLMGQSQFVGGLIAALLMACVFFMRGHRLMVSYLLGFGLLVWAAAVARTADPGVHFAWNGGGTRYLYVIAIMQAWALVLLMATQQGWRKAAASVLLILMMCTSFSMFALPQNGPWKISRADDAVEIVAPPGDDWKAVIPRAR